MVLSSQAPRTVSRSRYMTASRPARRGRGAALLAIVVLGAAAGAWAFFGRGDDSVTASPTDGAVEMATEVGRDGARDRDVQFPPAVVREPEPPVLTLGGTTPRRESTTTPPPAAEPAPEAAASQSADAGRRASTTDRPAPTIPAEPTPTRNAIPDHPWTGPGSGILDGEPLPDPDRPATRREGATGRQSGGAGGASGGGAGGGAAGPLQDALSLVRSDPVEARRRLTAVVLDPASRSAERARAREELNAINAQILFSPLVLPNDPFVRTYTVQSGDTLQRIARSQNLDADWRLLMRINEIRDERRIRVGQTLKLVTGAFHAVVHKAEYRMDVFLGESEDRVLVASFPVGLGEYNSTPTGRFKVRANSKLINPAWVNPRTGERFAADDPNNPIGERWIGLEGIDPANRNVEGYGIHGTIEPDSIGRQASMGCVRMLHDDVVLVYELLTEPNSVVVIRD